jgi:hypothetical protein
MLQVTLILDARVYSPLKILFLHDSLALMLSDQNIFLPKSPLFLCGVQQQLISKANGTINAAFLSSPILII